MSLHPELKAFEEALRSLPRRSLEDEIERLIEMVDLLDDDPDIEEPGDAEACLGWTEQGPGADGVAVYFDGQAHHDLELDTCDDEPWLGSPEKHFYQSQARWAQGNADGREEENEHGGDINDENHDDKDEGNDEPSMGWTERCGQTGVGMKDWNAYDDNSEFGHGGFYGDGHLAAQKVLRNLRSKRPDRAQEYVAVASAYGDPTALSVDGLKITGRPTEPTTKGDDGIRFVMLRPGVLRVC